MPSRKITDAQLSEMAVLRENDGLTYGEIAERIGSKAETVAWHCLRLGIDPPKPPQSWEKIRGPAITHRNGHEVRRFTADEDARILELEATGMSTYAIARAIKRPNNSTRARLMILARREARREARSA